MKTKGMSGLALVFRFWKFTVLLTALCASMRASLADQVPLITAGSTWQYKYGTNGPGNGWMGTPFFTSEAIGWFSGPAPLGYGDPGIATVFQGAESQPRPITAYLRRVFWIPDSAAYSRLLLNLRRDDGAVVYLNGTEVARSNMPDGEITGSTLAASTVGNEAESQFFLYELSTAALRSGTNVMAVELHQANAASSDMAFDLDLQGVLNDGPVLPVVSLEVGSTVITEPLAGSGIPQTTSLKVRRTGSTNSALVVYLSFTGSATPGADYSGGTNSVTIREGRTDAIITIVARPDTLVETNETVVVDVAEPFGLPTYQIDPTMRRSTVSIRDEDSATIAPSLVITQPLDGGMFPIGVDIVIKATAVDPNGYVPLVEFYDGAVLLGVSRIDFITAPPNGTPIYHEFRWIGASPGQHVLRARGVSSTGVAIASEPVQITVVNLPLVSIEATRQNTAEPPPFTLPGIFTVRRTGPTNEALNVWLTYSGTATYGIDYQAVSNLVVIPAGQFQNGVSITPLADFLFETNESVVATLVNGDYTIHADAASALIFIANSVTNPPVANVVSIEATRPNTKEPPPIGLSGEFTLRRTGPTNVALDVYLKYTGTATRGVDFRDIPNKFRFEAGRAETGFNIVPQSDFVLETNETVVAEVLAGTNGVAFPYIVDTNRNVAVVTIENTVTNPPPSVSTVSIVATRQNTAEPPAVVPSGLFTIRRTGPTNTALAVMVQYAGTATFAADYKQITNSVLFQPGQVERNLEVVPLVDFLMETNESVVANLLPGFGYLVDSNLFSAVVTIANSFTNPPIVSIEATRPVTSEPTSLTDVAPGQFTLRRSSSSTNRILSVMVSYGGSATRGVDYGMLSNVVTFQVGQTTATLQVMAFSDNLIEGDETVVAELVAPENPLAYQIAPDRNRAVVTIRDVPSWPNPDPIILAIESIDYEATERPTNSVIDPAIFVIRRVSGPTNIPVLAYYEMGGTASNGVDYLPLQGTVLLPTNQISVEIKITPKLDSLVEGDESVMITLLPPVCPPIFPPPPECYQVVSTNFAFATIHDFAPGTNQPPVAHIVKPLNGAVFTVGQMIEVITEASDPEGALEKVVITENGKTIGVAYGMNRYAFNWWGATVGQHTLVASPVDLDGNIGRSEPVTILVREQNASAFVFRRLPDAYTPGISFTVELRAEPPAGARAYAVEDRPPVGWTVSQISHEGVFDAATGKVKFGPFFDANSRTLTYRLSPPSTAAGAREFAGAGSIDGASYPIGGDRLIQQGSTKHPADKDGNWSIVLNELTAYAAAWKSGASWSNGPVPIPASYVTRAGFIWRRGEGYTFNAALGAPPLCWVPTNGPSSNTLAAAYVTVEECVRVGGEGLKPGIASQMQINVTPKSGTTAYVVEEHVPSGWVVANVSHDGTFDAETGTIRWGIFLDGNSRTFSYTVTPPAAVAEIGRLRGIVSFDGSLREITGADRVISVEGLPRLVRCETDANGVRLQLSGPAGQVGVLQRSSDLKTWEDVTTLFLPDGSVEYFDTDGTKQTQNYYRLQIR